jgi:SAM-dependent methyltransferase
MHQSSLENLAKAVKLLSLNENKKIKILDVGGRGLKGDRSYFSIVGNLSSEYHIADIQEGENVTHVMPGEYIIPASDEYYDLIVSGQTLEHVKNPFKLVKEMTRVLKKNSFIIIIAPSTGPRHDVIDCWRFMDDSFKAIAEETELELIADWIDNQSTDKKSVMWKDHTFVGKKHG